LPTCPKCGFERSDPRECPICASYGDAKSPRGNSALARIAAALGRFILPLIAASALILASAWLYLALPPDQVDPRLDAPGAAVAQAPAIVVAPASVAAPESARAIPRISESLPSASEKEYIAWMLAHSDEKSPFLEKKWIRAQAILARKDITGAAVLRAFLYTPREYFARAFNMKKAYDDTAIPIGYGQTISGPHMVSHMTQSVEPLREDRILEIGTGSGYQSAVLSELSDHVYTIEIVPALFKETDGIYRKLAKRYPEYDSITRKNADGYYGWVQYAPFQKIIVTAGIDHIPPPLLSQLAPNGIIVIPVGPPSGQTVLRIVKRPAPGGGFAFERSDIYRGRKVIFVPFTSQGGARHSLDDSGSGESP
jgi:protein-L-isoaspartate(D-aspartate) O-methyltransferase